MPLDNKNKGGAANAAGDAILGVTGTVGALVGGVSRTAGGVVGGAGRGLGETVNNTTGTKAVGNALQAITGGVEEGVNKTAKGIEDGSRGKAPFGS